MKYNEIYHHGILGQQWGVRRYQNEDGSLTTAGRQRYSTDLALKKNAVNSASSMAKEAGNISKKFKNNRVTAKTEKRLSDMSDQELKETVKRMNMEQQYVDLSSKKVSRGRIDVQGTLEIAGSVLAITGSALSIALSINQLKQNQMT